MANPISRRLNAYATQYHVQQVTRAFALLGGTSDPLDFAARLDSTQAKLFRHLSRTYGDRTFAMLVSLKVCNLLCADYHFRHGHARLASRAVQLMIDPANACQLRCPGCVHSGNKQWADQFDWLRGAMPLDRATGILDEFGPFGMAAVFYNYGEPLLNRDFPDIVRVAKGLGMFAMTSSNLSLPLNADALVASGLDWLTVSIDGTTQETYGQFRRNGDLRLAMRNVRALVDAKKRAGSTAPYLSWQFLTFEHNDSQVEDAIDLARSIGVDAIQVATPFSVEEDDPRIHPVRSKREGNWQLTGAPLPNLISSYDQLRSAAIEKSFSMSWSARLRDLGVSGEPAQSARRGCQWLYHNLTFDAGGRAMPCCIAPTSDKSVRNLVFGRFGADHDLTNSKFAVLARQVQSAKTTGPFSGVDGQDIPYCVSCTARPRTPYGFDVADSLTALDRAAAIPSAVYDRLRSAPLYRRPEVQI